MSALRLRAIRALLSLARPLGLGLYARRGDTALDEAIALAALATEATGIALDDAQAERILDALAASGAWLLGVTGP